MGICDLDFEVIILFLDYETDREVENHMHSIPTVRNVVKQRDITCRLC